MYAIIQLTRGYSTRKLEDFYRVTHKQICNWADRFDAESQDTVVLFQDEYSLSNTATLSATWSPKGKQLEISCKQVKKERITGFGSVNPLTYAQKHHSQPLFTISQRTKSQILAVIFLLPYG
jgi:hypothetical protein